MPRAGRLTLKKDIERVMKHGWRKVLVPAKFFCLPEVSMKMTVVVGTQISKKAVVRNRLKRLARESYRHQLPALTRGWWLIKPQQAAIGLTYDDWKKLWSEIIKLQPKARA